MLDTTNLRTMFAIACARALEDGPGDDLTLADRLDEHLGSFAVVLHTALGTGRTAAGDALADRLWVEMGIARRL